MSTKNTYYCDRCEEEMITTDLSVAIKVDQTDLNKINTLLGKEPQLFWHDEHWDLCESCSKKWIEFMRYNKDRPKSAPAMEEKHSCEECDKRQYQLRVEEQMTAWKGYMNECRHGAIPGSYVNPQDPSVIIYNEKKAVKTAWQKLKEIFK